MPAVRNEAYLALEKSLAGRLVKGWNKFSGPLLRSIWKEIQSGDIARARQLARGINLTPVLRENMKYIEYMTKASMLFGATRVTDDPEDTEVAQEHRASEEAGEQAIEIFAASILENVESAIREGLLLLIDEIELEDSVQKYDEDQPRDEFGRWTSYALDQAMANVGTLSRSIGGGVLDTSASKDKAGVALGGTKDKLTSNFKNAFNYAHSHANDKFETPADLRKVIDGIGERVTDGIVTQMYRQFDSAKFPYSRAGDIEADMEKFVRELHARLDSTSDPVGTAAWAKFEYNRIHPLSDGVSRATEVLGDFVLYRNGVMPPRMNSRTRDDYIKALAGGLDTYTQYHRDVTIKYDPDQPRDAQGRWVYHGTQPDRVEKIRVEGLKPSEAGNPLNFHEDFEVASDYYGKGGAVYRVPKDKLPRDIRHDPLTHHYWTSQPVPPENIEQLLNGQWINLKTKKYDPDQPRIPAGEAGAGQWAKEGAGAQYDASRKVWSIDGKPMADKDQERLKALKVPPAWTGVRINPDANGDLQAVGKDSKGRTQYLYSAAHTEKAAAEKFARLKDFNAKVPGIVATSLKDMKGGGSREERDTAAVVQLIAKTGFRIGSDGDTKTKHTAYGASTLMGHHVKVDGDKLTFGFIGKKGVRINKTFEDAALASYIKSIGPTKDRKLFETSETLVRDYFHKIAGDEFKVKDLRTWQGTAKAIEKASKLRPPKTEKEYKKWRREIGVAVSKHLGNTPTVALASYIDPSVFKPYHEKWGVKKADSFEKLYAVMNDYFETTHFVEDRVIKPWQQVPETGHDPDDETVEKYDDDQPRGEDGKWIATGAVPSAGVGKAISSMPVGRAASKEAKAWRKQMQAKYDSDPEFRAAMDAATLFTQGDYPIVRAMAEHAINGKFPAHYQDSLIPSWVDKPMHGSPMSRYRTYFDGQPFQWDESKVAGQRMEQSKATWAEGARALNAAIRDAEPLSTSIFRGLRDSALARQLVDTLKPGHVLDVVGASSFTRSQEIATDFAWERARGQSKATHRESYWATKVVMEIKAGAKGLPVNAISPWDQQEVISSGRFKVVSIEDRNKSNHGGKDVHIVLEQIGVWDNRAKKMEVLHANEAEDELVSAVFGAPFLDGDHEERDAPFRKWDWTYKFHEDQPRDVKGRWTRLIQALFPEGRKKVWDTKLHNRFEDWMVAVLNNHGDVETKHFRDGAAEAYDKNGKPLAFWDGYQGYAHQIRKFDPSIPLKHLVKITKLAKIRNFTSFSEAANSVGDKMMQVTSALHTSRLSAYGFLVEAKLKGYSEYQISAQLDKRACAVCEYMDGKTFSIEDLDASLEEIFAAKSPDDLEHIQEWPGQDKESLNAMMEMSDAELADRNWNLPPWHPGCRCLCVVVGTPEMPENTRSYQEAEQEEAISPPNSIEEIPEQQIERIANRLDGLEGPHALAVWEDLADEWGDGVLEELTGLTEESILLGAVLDKKKFPYLFE